MRFSSTFLARTVRPPPRSNSFAPSRFLSSSSSPIARPTSRAASISFLGLGRMGSEMAFNLFSKRYALGLEDAHAGEKLRFVVCDAVPEAAHAFARKFQSQFPGSEVRVVDTPEEATLASSTIVTMLPSSPQVRTVYTESNGVMAALSSLPSPEREQTLCIDSTTLDVDVARQVALDVTKTGAWMVDAPVSGGVTGAKAGTLTFLVGGSEAAFDLASPVLAAMGRRIVHCGDAGTGLIAKICNNLMLGVQQVVTAEAMLLGQRLGIRADVLADVVGSATGACWSMSANNPVPGATPGVAMPSERDFEGGFATMLMIKDMGLAAESAKKVGTALPLGLAAQRIYEETVKSRPELGRKDFSSVYKYLEHK